MGPKRIELLPQPCEGCILASSLEKKFYFKVTRQWALNRKR